MPTRTVTIHRWQVAVAFAAITATFVVGLKMVADANNATHRIAVRADGLSRDLAAEGQKRTELRDEQLRLLHESEVSACASRHLLVGSLRGLLKRSLDATVKSDIPDLTPAQERVVAAQRAQLISDLINSLAELDEADCHGVPPLPDVASG